MKMLGSFWTTLLVLVMVASQPARAAADEKLQLTGGGQGTFANGRIDPWDKNGLDGDLDGDGHVDGSYYTVAVTVNDETVQGHFVCAMWGNTRILGLPLMAVEGAVSVASINEKTHSVTLQGVGTVDLGGPSFTNVPFRVRVTAGGQGEATLQLTVIGVFDGVPGDTILGNGNYDLPAETLISGLVRISKH
ncbi:MAG TPA: hypothetical protein VKE51_15680 [Vicinamibacterales bacterium]|nr:hypothetical protein [Vicinamibacterales bacterium]